MPIRLGRFEMPRQIVKDEAEATENYAKYIAEPFEAGYGRTIGNSLRRVLLSSLEGAAIASVKIEGALHEFCNLPGVVEDVTDIVLNLKHVLLCTQRVARGMVEAGLAGSVTSVTSKRVNPPWTPTPDMVRNNPRLPRWVPGGHPMNPLGIRAMYLGSSAYRIHGTPAPASPAAGGWE